MPQPKERKRYFPDHITGKVLRARLDKLAEEANHHDAEADKHWDTWLEHVYHAGAALQEAYERLGRRGKWCKWCNERFNKKGRTEREYRQIFRHWDDPAMIEARSFNTPLNSIRAVLRVLRGAKTDTVPRKRPPRPIDEYLRREFASFVRKLDDVEKDVAAYWIHTLISRFYDTLKDKVCIHLDHDPYETEFDRQQKAELRRSFGKGLAARAEQRKAKQKNHPIIPRPVPKAIPLPKISSR